MVKTKKNKLNRISFYGPVLLALIFFISGLNSIVTASVNCENYDGNAKQECEDLQDKIKDAQKIINLKEKQETTIKNQLNLINIEQNKNQTEIQKNQQKAKDLAQQIESLNKDIQEKSDSIKYQSAVLGNLIQSYYEDYQQGTLNIVLADDNFSQLLNQADYSRQVGSKINDTLQEIQDTKKDLEDKKNELEGKKKESDDIKDQLQSRNLSLQHNEDQKQIILGQTLAEKKKYEDLLSEIEDEIQQLDAGKGQADLSSLPPLKKGYFTYPVSVISISQRYGKTSFSNHYSSGKHNGIDFAVKYKNVFAAKSGRVLAIGNNGKYGYGKWIAIDHGDGLVTLYGHFSKQMVSKGSSVKEGQVIGISGNTGYSTGPHLHFSVFSKKSFEIVESTKVAGLMLPIGSAVDPMRYLR